LSQRVTLLAADATSALPDRAAAVISVGATHVWAPRAGEAAEPLHYDVALSRIRDLVPRGTRIVYADGIWSRPPTSQATEPLGGRADEFVSLAELVTLAVNAGFAIYATHEATTDEWDHFESGYSACYARWLAEHSDDHPEAAEVRGLAERQREGYLAGYRNVLGFAYLHLVAV
jgi:hypothetical protein